jgi:hypothetical protein
MFLSSVKLLALSAVVAISASWVAHAAEDIAGPAITLIDSRSTDQLAARRDSIFSAIAFLPDKTVSPSPLEQLQSALRSHYGAATPLQLSINQLRVIDFFPHRLKAPKTPGDGLLMDALAGRKTDWAFVQDMQVPLDQDSVICLLVGTLNGQEIKAYAFTPYHVSGFSIMIRSDKNFKAAVSSSIDKVAQKIVASNTVVQAGE